MSEGIHGKVTLDGKLFRVSGDDSGLFVDRWTLVSRRTGRLQHHWQRIWPLPNGSTLHSNTAELVIAAVKGRRKEAGQ
jgi:hypothetical protein